VKPTLPERTEATHSHTTVPTGDSA